MAFPQLTAYSSFSHEVCLLLLLPLRPDCAQCLTGQQPTSSPGSQCPWPRRIGLWELVASSSEFPSPHPSPYSQDGAYKLSLSCFFGFFFFSLQPQD